MGKTKEDLLPYKPDDAISAQIMQICEAQEGENHPMECEMVKSAVYLALSNMGYSHADITHYWTEKGDVWLTNAELHNLGHLIFVQGFFVGKAAGILLTTVQGAAMAQLLDEGVFTEDEAGAVLAGELEGERADEIKHMVVQRARQIAIGDDNDNDIGIAAIKPDNGKIH